MTSTTKENIGCLGSIAVVYLLVWILGTIFSGPPAPPMSDAELHSRIAKMKGERRQHCIATIRDTVHLWPKDMQKYASGAMAKCGEDD